MFDIKLRKIIGYDVGKGTKDVGCENPKIKFSNEICDENNKVTLRISRNNTVLSRKLTDESNRLIDEVNEITKNWQCEVDHQTRERIDEIQFLSEELQKQRKRAKMEEEALITYRNRLMDLKKKVGKGLEMANECMRLRNCRGGLDLCRDEVEIQLIEELKVIIEGDQLISHVLDEIKKQLTRLSAAYYLLDKDMEYKANALKIDSYNLVLKEQSSNLSPELDPTRQLCVYTLAEWQQRTAKNIEDNAKELTGAVNMRAYIDVLLTQLFNDLQRQTERTNEAFRKRISETRAMKHLLEAKHLETTNEVINIEKNIFNLTQELNDRERSMALCQTRLANRSRRLDLESTCDMAQQALMNEFQYLKTNFVKIKQKIAENKAMLRYLTYTVTMQQEEINIKANTLKIDEVDCQTMRLALNYKE